MAQQDVVCFKNHRDKDGKLVQVTFVAEKTEVDVQYPREWFDKNPGLKPPLVLPINQKAEFLKVAQHTLAYLGIDKLTLDQAMCYLGMFCSQEMEELLQEDWISFGRVIGKRGEVITPLNLLDCSGREIAVSVAPTDCDPKHLMGIAMYILMVGRYQLSQNHATYRQTFDKNFGNQLKSAGITKAVTQMGTAHVEWPNDRHFQTLCAAIDMFLFKFNTSKFTPLRIGTIHLRDKDGSARTTFNNFLLMHNMRFLEFCQCIYVPEIITEIIRMTEPGQEMENQFSYAIFGPGQSEYPLFDPHYRLLFHRKAIAECAAFTHGEPWKCQIECSYNG